MLSPLYLQCADKYIYVIFREFAKDCLMQMKDYRWIFNIEYK